MRRCCPVRPRQGTAARSPAALSLRQPLAPALSSRREPLAQAAPPRPALAGARAAPRSTLGAEERGSSSPNKPRESPGTRRVKPGSPWRGRGGCAPNKAPIPGQPLITAQHRAQHRAWKESWWPHKRRKGSRSWPLLPRPATGRRVPPSLGAASASLPSIASGLHSPFPGTQLPRTWTQPAAPAASAAAWSPRPGPRLAPCSRGPGQEDPRTPAFRHTRRHRCGATGGSRVQPRWGTEHRAGFRLRLLLGCGERRVRGSSGFSIPCPCRDRLRSAPPAGSPQNRRNPGGPVAAGRGCGSLPARRAGLAQPCPSQCPALGVCEAVPGTHRADLAPSPLLLRLLLPPAPGGGARRGGGSADPPSAAAGRQLEPLACVAVGRSRSYPPVPLRAASPGRHLHCPAGGGSVHAWLISPGTKPDPSPAVALTAEPRGDLQFSGD